MVNSSILQAGTRVKITEKAIAGGVLLPNSVCYYSRCYGAMSRWLTRHTMFLIRRGKTGKERLTVLTATVPTFWGPETVDYMREKGGMGLAFFEPAQNLTNNAMSLPPIEFLGWAAAMAVYLRHIGRRPDMYAMWPKDQQYILNKLVRDVTMGSANDARIAMLKDIYACDNARSKIVKEVYKMSATLSNGLAWQHRRNVIDLQRFRDWAADQPPLKDWYTDLNKFFAGVAHV